MAKLTCKLPQELNGDIKAVAKKFGWSNKKAELKIAATTIMASANRIADCDDLKSAADFLLGRLQNSIVCDGCRVNDPFEHRCHGRLARVNDQVVGHHCQCPGCYVLNVLGH